METAKTERWRGILANEQAVVRHSVAAVLFTLAAAVPLGSLGFYPVGDTHVLISIIPVAIAALLFGKWCGCAVGATAGFAEMIHAMYQPYNYYEKYFAMPVNSVLLFALLGLGLGALFAYACRATRLESSAEDEPPARSATRMGAIAAVAAVGSVFFTALLQIGIVVTDSALVLGLPPDLSARAFDVKAMLGQIGIHLVFMALPCMLTDSAVRRYSFGRRKLSVRTTFQLWFGALMVGFFFVASAAAYVAITHLSVVNMNAALSDQIDLLTYELSQRDNIVNTLNARGVLPKDELRGFADQQYRRINCDLAGWSQDVVVLAMDDVIFASNDERLVGSSLEGMVTPSLGDATLADAFRSDTAIECYQGQGYEISYLRAVEKSYDRLEETGSYQFAIIVPSREVFLNRGLYMHLVAAVFAAMLGAIFVLLMRLLKRVVVRPVDSANEALGRITEGELDQRVPDDYTAEFSSLALGINTTLGALEDSIAEANARIDREFAAARAIQEGSLPTAQPPFPHIDAFDLYATMDPAREVGGDFYDYFDLGERGIGFVVADVSGKGMPAALFMMAAKAAIRGAIAARPNLAEAVRVANRNLCEGNESEMFVTVFAGVFDYRTGKLTYVNAGHNKPLLMHDGAWRWLRERSGPYLGSFDWVEYKQFECLLVPGDELFVYTDGVNEAFDANEERYGNDRLEAFLASHSALHPRRLLRAIRADLIGWAVGAEQSDDITMLALKYGIPPEHGASLTTTASLDHFEEVMGFVEQRLGEVGCPRKESNRVLTVVEELVVNVCSYAYPETTPDELRPLRIHFTHRTDPSAVVIEIGDDGVPFDPLAREDPKLPTSIEEAKVGGLGLVMTKKLMDEVEYVREGIANVTIITKRWE